MPADQSSVKLSEEQCVEMFRLMVLSRTLDERIWLLNRQGKAAIVASAQGHEAAQLGSVWALRKNIDQFYTYYRDLTVLIALGMTPIDIMLGFMAKAGEPLSGARQFPLHGAREDLKLVNLSNVVGTQIPQAVGAALASKMRGEEIVTICYFGDGAASVGDCHEGMNFASVHQLPVIFFCENNRYAISVPLEKQMNVSTISGRAEGYGMPGVTIDGTDILAVHEATSVAYVRACSGQGPTLIEAMVERYLPHTSDDDDSRYRSKKEIEESQKRDPLKLLGDYLANTGALSQDLRQEFFDKARKEVDQATELAEQMPYPNTNHFLDHVYSGDHL